MRIKILDHLQQVSEKTYRSFSKKLLPPDTKLLGVRIPFLRRYAKILIKEGEGRAYLNIPLESLEYQEEFMLHALILAHIKMSVAEKNVLICRFVPYIKNWAVCDIFCADLKEIKNNPKMYYHMFLPYAQSGKEYQVRFFYVIALNYFMNEQQLSTIFENISRQIYTGFYDKMAVAWLLSVAYVKFPQETENFLFQTHLDAFVFHKSISKICDSFRVTKAAKIHLRTLAAENKRSENQS